MLYINERWYESCIKILLGKIREKLHKYNNGVGMDSILTAARIQEVRLETLANNIANINTVGFKEDKIFHFEEIFHEKENDSAKSTGSYLPSDSTLTLPIGTFTDLSQGAHIQTGNPLDFSIEGKGFFTVSTPDGNRYTRNGNFSINDEGILVTQDGYPVLGSGGEITVEGENFSVDEKGNLYVDDSQFDTFQIEVFDDPGALKKVGKTLFKPNDSRRSGSTSEEAVIHQGFLEQSNVQSVIAMTEMIEVLRGYEAYQKALKSIDHINSKAINDVGSLM
jgi:flagellar basal-body rod protein FlgG